MRSAALLLTSLTLGACVSAPKPEPRPQAPAAVRPATPPPQSPPAQQPVAPNSRFIAPQVMRLPGLEGVIGQRADALERVFGKARLDVKEGDVRKLQFAGEPCVLDIYLYPLSPGAAPTATHVEARRSSDGQSVDRAACVRALGAN
ncbi:hypothetical protein P7228_05925 [Altererythrobacter arenosus]|uniref:DUF3035 domain-containing protein n=2 Tax=Altererythrobacter arenosus TaxID=3032592 RepID=A0ABY8FY70_9SPHN|nr:hypothetical protein [Altererythrobacter sp. CAU 1644]WFL79025.1 hypothetical protein P7228_05925 [Altererythrobacter sp. CAU 1644]